MAFGIRDLDDISNPNNVTCSIVLRFYEYHVSSENCPASISRSSRIFPSHGHVFPESQADILQYNTVNDDIYIDFILLCGWIWLYKPFDDWILLNTTENQRQKRLRAIGMHGQNRKNGGSCKTFRLPSECIRLTQSSYLIIVEPDEYFIEQSYQRHVFIRLLKLIHIRHVKFNKAERGLWPMKNVEITAE